LQLATCENLKHVAEVSWLPRYWLFQLLEANSHSLETCI